jgi:hypothetical protein
MQVNKIKEKIEQLMWKMLLGVSIILWLVAIYLMFKE